MIQDTLKNALNDNFSMIFIFSVVIVALRLMYIHVHKEKFVLYKETFMFAFLLYALLLFYVVTFQDVNYGTNNFIPFKEILRYEVGSKVFIKNIVGNIILFIPFGFFVAHLMKSKKLYPTLVVSMITSIVIEYTQLKIGRTFDIDDIILNIAGGFLGYLIYIIIDTLEDHMPQVLKTETFKNIITIIIVLLLIFVYTNFSLWGILR